MLARRRNAAQRRGPVSAATTAGAGTSGGPNGANAGGDAGLGEGGSSSSPAKGAVAAVIEERLNAFAPCVLPSLVNENRLDDAVGSPPGDESGGAAAAVVGAPSSLTPPFGGAHHHPGTVAQAVLLMYLHIGNDPPDFPRIEPCAKMECWVDPMVAHVSQYGPSRSRGAGGSASIAETLEQQYRTILGESASVHRVAESSVDTVRSVLSKARHGARDERVLVHYNGHGMPRATELGEVWMFDKEKTHYVPLGILETAERVGSPTLYVLDCNAAGAVLKRWCREGMPERRPHDLFICACEADETLPLNPRLPADMLTACLTTPLKMALEWYISFSHFKVLLPDVSADMIRNMPGSPKDRHSPLGELGWVLAAITTTIAWCTLSADQFHVLFRQDATTRAAFRNAILADRLMREAGCTPVTYPKLSDAAHLHPMWELWEHTLERTISQLPRLMGASAAAAPSSLNEGAGAFPMSASPQIAAAKHAAHPLDSAVDSARRGGGAGGGLTINTAAAAASGSYATYGNGRVPRTPAATYEPSSFLDDQLTAFAVWVHSGDTSQLPEQLPCVLLALAQSTHQVRAFTLLAKYLDSGRTAGKRAILCGILPYLSKLLTQAPRAFLIVAVLWMQVIRADPAEGCGEMQRSQSEKYFTSLLKLDERETKIAPVEYGESVNSAAGNITAKPASQASVTQQQGPGGHKALRMRPEVVTQRPSQPVVTAPSLYRPASLPAVPSGNSLDVADNSPDLSSGANDVPPQPLQPTSSAAGGASGFGSTPNLAAIANHAIQPGDTIYYLMKDVDLSRVKSMACYILCQYQQRGERQCLLCWNNRLLSASFPNLSSTNAELRSWSCLVLSKLFCGLRHAKSFASRECASRLDLFTRLLQDRSPQVRSSCVTLLASVVGVRMDILPEDQQIRRLQMEKSLLIKLRGYIFDASMSVREELIFFASQVLNAYRNALPTEYRQQIHQYVAAIGDAPSQQWRLSEADVAVKSLLNTARPTVSAQFDDAITFDTTFLTRDDPLPATREMEPDKLCPAALEMTEGLLHDAALMLCILYRNCDSNNVNKALRTLSMGEAPQSQRFASEALRTMSHVASLDSSYYLSEADRTRMTWNADMMRQLVLDTRGRKLEPHQVKSSLRLGRASPVPPDRAAATADTNGGARLRSPSRTMPRSNSSSNTLTSAESPSPRGGSVAASGADGGATTTATRHQVLRSAVPSDSVVCTAFRALEASMVVATKKQYVHYISYDSYSAQNVVNSFPVRLSGPVHDVLVINDLSEQSGLLFVTKRGGFSLMKGCWEQESIPTEAAAFSACPPPPPNQWLDIKSAYRTSTATLFYGGPIGEGENAGRTEIHILSLAEEQVSQKLEVSGNPAITSLVTHTTQRSVFAGFNDGVVRYYDDRQRQGQLGTVGMMMCRAPASSGGGGGASSTPLEPVVGLGLIVPDFSGTDSSGSAGGSAHFTLAAATRSSLFIFDARRLNEPVSTVAAAELYKGAAARAEAAEGASPPITGCSVGAHTGLIALSFADGTYGAYNSKGVILNDRPTLVASYAAAQRAGQQQPVVPLPLPSSCAAHPLRPLMSFGGDLMFLQL